MDNLNDRAIEVDTLDANAGKQLSKVATDI